MGYEDFSSWARRAWEAVMVAQLAGHPVAPGRLSDEEAEVLAALTKPKRRKGSPENP